MNPTSALWDGLALGAGSRFRILTVEGWEELPAPRYDKTARSRAHGTHRSQVWADERIVTVTGFNWSATERDQLLVDLQRAMVFGGGETPLQVTMAGRTLTAGAQLLAARAAVLRGEWGIGRFGWLAQWRCPDPLRYGLPQAPVSTGLPTSGGGVDYPLTYPLTYGAAGNPGQLTLTNDGTADAPIPFQVTGPLPAGFEISAAGLRLRYEGEVPAGQTLIGDTGFGTLLAEGTADRRPNLTVADWIQVPARSAITVQFSSLGGAPDPTATLTVPGFRSASW